MDKFAGVVLSTRVSFVSRIHRSSWERVLIAQTVFAVVGKDISAQHDVSDSFPQNCAGIDAANLL